MHLPFTSVIDRWHPGRNTQAISKLETLPIELLEIIFRFACTDGGRTGCNLALVSKYIRVTSRASRFHSVSMLAGLVVQLHRFLLALHRAQIEAQAEGAPIPRVRHLCILLTPAVNPFDPDIRTTDLDRSIIQHQKTLLAHLSREARIAQEFKVFKVYCNAFRHLFAAVRAHLETLCLLRFWYCSFPAPPPIPCPGGFPRLREFTFSEELPPFAPPADGTPMYPALARLHTTMRCHDSKVDFAWWAANAPRLSLLRINTTRVFPRDDVHIVSQLACILGPDTDNRRERHPTAPALSFSHLKTLMFMITPILFPDFSPPVAAAYAASASTLDAELRALRVPHTVFQPHYHGQDMLRPRQERRCRPGELEEGMRRDWLLRVGGGQGFFTPELWTRAETKAQRHGVLQRLWEVVRRDKQML